MSKILLVEDNPDAVKRIIRYINKIFAELDVISFPEAGDALQYAKANDISLFILDIQLEDYKGTNLAKQLRELPEYKYTPIIFETALAGEELSAYRDVKCYSFLVKPFGEEEFAAAFRDALGLSKQMNQQAKTIQIEQKQWIIIILILAVLLLDSILLFLHQRRMQEQKRIHMIEQYVPIVEELISQVRARQHEFNNRMMAIEAVVTSADTLEEARKEVTALTGSIGISLNDRELLSCDSKMIAGMLFGKIKQAEAANRHIELSLHGLFKKTVTPETEWIEAIGILLDNAIEASPKGSTVFLSSKKQGDFLELTVANPAPPLSNTEFMALFGKGVTTKANRDGHGFGLYNILRMTERYHGKILTRNESILNENYVVFGVLMP